jgi:hypothetical protein
LLKRRELLRLFSNASSVEEEMKFQEGGSRGTFIRLLLLGEKNV